MSDEREIKPDEDEECCCCHASNVLLHVFTEKFADNKAHQHCDFCYETLAGKACECAANYGRDAAEIMRHVNLVANLLLRKLGSR